MTLYRNWWTNVPPMPSNEQLSRVLSYPTLIVPCGRYLYIIAPMLMMPIT